MATNPWMTSSDIIDAVKRKISFPSSQQTFTDSEILKFANEEMFISQVPSVLEFHSEYYVNILGVPLISNVSRYPIPNRAIGMKLRDLFYADADGNLTEMTRIDEGDKSFWQKNVGANNSLHKFYLQGDDVIVTPSVTSGATGSLVFVYFLRPNQLVADERAATITGFQNTITVHNALVSPLDTVTIGSDVYTAVSTLGGTITAITSLSSSTTQITTSSNHQLTSGQTVVITGSNSTPSIDGTYVASVTGTNTFTIQKQVGIAGTSGTFTCTNQFQISTTDALTAANLAASVSALGNMTATASSGVVTVSYNNIQTIISTSNTTGGFELQNKNISIQFSSLPATYLDPDTNVTSTLFAPGVYVDFLQTKPGHRIWSYDIQIPANGISGNVLTIPASSLMVTSGSIGSGSVPLRLADLVPGDYMCLSNEAIIPQLPPDLHNGLAERAAARILAAIGDQQGLQSSMSKIQEIEKRQGNLLSDRVDGAPLKITNRYSILRLGKTGLRKRY